MQKRTIIFGSYNTAEHGWTLGQWTLTDAEQKTNYVEKPAGDGSWDLSTAQTDGIPRYKNRTLTVPLECSKGTREDRLSLVSEMVNQLDGFEWQIVLPDHPDHYLVGRLRVAVNYCDLAHAMVTVTGNVEPWLYSARENITEIVGTGLEGEVYLYNRGRKAVVPTLMVEGDIRLSIGEASVLLDEGVYKWPSLLLLPGHTHLRYSGTGTLTVTFREAVLR
jgi:hypothetical protein